ncbi:MAG: phospholipase D-like domain-containing protein [Microscillaceae bacterium]
MQIETILELFEKTFEDRQLTRVERQALSQILQDTTLSTQNIGYLRNQIFTFAKEHLLSFSALQVLDWLEKANKLLNSQQKAELRPAEAYFSPGEDCRQALLRYIRQARHQLWVCVFTISDDLITEALQEAFRRKVDVRILTDDDKSFDKGSDIRALAQAGVLVKMDNTPNHMHHKFALIDQEILITGSYNWTRSAARYNHENVVILYEPALLNSFTREFESLWEKMVDFKMY